MKRRSAVLAACAAIAWPALAQERAALGAIRARLVTAALLRGQFEQRKSVKGFKQPLVSRGDFVVLRGKGVLWRTREPLLASLVLTRSRLVSLGADGAVEQQLDAAREPALRGITELMFAMLSVDLDVLTQRFDVVAQLKPGQDWQMTLLPKDKVLAQSAAKVEIEGDQQVRQVQWSDGQGDLNVIRMSGQRSGGSLSRDEEAWFD